MHIFSAPEGTEKIYTYNDTEIEKHIRMYQALKKWQYRLQIDITNSYILNITWVYPFNLLIILTGYLDILSLAIDTVTIW